MKQELTAHEVAMGFTQQEREEIRSMKVSPRLYQQVSICKIGKSEDCKIYFTQALKLVALYCTVAQSIAPTTFGYTKVKRRIFYGTLEQAKQKN